MKSRLVTLALIILALCVGCIAQAVRADEEIDYLIYLPIASKPRATATCTPTPTDVPPTVTPMPTATSVPVPTATPSPKWRCFINYPYDTRMKGLWTGTAWRTSLTPWWGTTYYPKGVFLVMFMDVVNLGMGSDHVTSYAFDVGRCSGGSHFDPAGFSQQLAVQDEYGRDGFWCDLQPEFTYRMVFVFDVPAVDCYRLWLQEPCGCASISLTRAVDLADAKANHEVYLEERAAHLKGIGH